MGLNDNCSRKYCYAAILLGVEPTRENIRDITKIFPTLSELQKDMSKRGLKAEKDYSVFAIGDISTLGKEVSDIVYEHILNRLEERKCITQ